MKELELERRQRLRQAKHERPALRKAKSSQLAWIINRTRRKEPMLFVKPEKTGSFLYYEKKKRYLWQQQGSKHAIEGASEKHAKKRWTQRGVHLHRKELDHGKCSAEGIQRMDFVSQGRIPTYRRREKTNDQPTTALFEERSQPDWFSRKDQQTPSAQESKKDKKMLPSAHIANGTRTGETWNSWFASGAREEMLTKTQHSPKVKKRPINEKFKLKRGKGWVWPASLLIFKGSSVGKVFGGNITHIFDRRRSSMMGEES